MQTRIDISVLPNNNHPDKYLQLDVGTLPGVNGLLQLGAAMSSQRTWQNRVYYQRKISQVITHSIPQSKGEERKMERRPSPSPEHAPVAFVDRYMEKHITPVTFTPNIKTNPLYMDTRIVETGEVEKTKPSWTIKEYDVHTLNGNLYDYMEDERKTEQDLDFWLEDLYTPGFDSLLKKKEAEHRQKKLCRILAILVLCICVIVVIITVPVMVT